MKKVFTYLMVFMVMSFLAVAANAEVETGAMAPDFTLKSETGTDVTLSDYKGSHVVLEWTNHQCPFVVKHYESGNMQALQEKWTGKDVAWLSIVSSAPGKQGHRETPKDSMEITMEQEAKPTAVLFDPSGEVGQTYGAKTTPHMFVIDPTGKIVYQGAIDSVASVNPDDIDGADNYVDMALAKSMDGEMIETHTTKPYGCSVKY